MQPDIPHTTQGVMTLQCEYQRINPFPAAFNPDGNGRVFLVE